MFDDADDVTDYDNDVIDNVDDVIDNADGAKENKASTLQEGSIHQQLLLSNQRL